MKKQLLLLILLPLLNCATPARIIIVRHGEKLDQSNPGPYLSQLGQARANALPAYFVKNFGTPDFIFAQAPKNAGSSLRPIQTLTPTATHYIQLNPTKADQFVINSQKEYTHSEYPDLAQKLLSDSKYAGKTILISWEHKVIPDFATKLGIKNPPSPWSDTAFDQTWVIEYDQKHGKPTSFTICTQNLNLPNDTNSKKIAPGQPLCHEQKID